MIARARMTTTHGLVFLAALAASGCTLQLGEYDDGEHRDDEIAEAESGGDVTEALPSADPATPAADPPSTAGDEEDENHPPQEDEFSPPDVVTVSIVGAVVRPWDSYNEYWDSTSTVSTEMVQSLAYALGAAAPYVAVTGLIYDLAVGYYAHPEPYGTAQVFLQNSWQDQLDVGLTSEFSNTLVPSFDGAPGWEHVSVEENMRIRVSLNDADRNGDDPIGIVELNYDDIVAAAEVGQVHHVQTDDQGTGTILFVGISVVDES